MLRDEAPRLALDTPFRTSTLLDAARDAVAIARTGLRNRRSLDDKGQDETRYLDVLEGFVASARAPADELLRRYETTWKHDVRHVFEDYVF